MTEIRLAEHVSRKLLPSATLAALLIATSGCGTGGDGPLDDSSSGGGPVTLPDDFSVAAALHGASVGGMGSVFTWGSNAFGQLGNGTTTSSTSPVEVAGFTTAVQVEAGRDFTLVRLADGTLQAWGDNDNGQLGDNSTIASLVPTPSLLTNVVQVNVLGTAQTVIARLADGTVWTWGRNDLGQIGDGTIGDVLSPVEVVPALNAVDVAMGEFHALAALAGGTVLSWGLNINGQLGNGTTTSSSVPVTVTGVATADAVACGSTFSLALLANGTVVAWGDNTFGALGNGTTTDSTTPVVVTGLAGITKIDATSDTAVALASDGTVWTWGAGGSGQLGDGTSTPSQTTPVQVTIAGETVVDIDCGDNTVLVITADGSRYAWGLNTTGVFGDGSTTSSSSPELVTNF